MLTNNPLVKRLVRLALEEDIGTGDVTTETVVPAGTRAVAQVQAKAHGVLAGLPVARFVLSEVDPFLEVVDLKQDGDEVAPGDVVMRARGSAQSLLMAERTALDFLMRLSGVATATRAFARALDGTKTVLLDTRKTTPGLRRLEKYAVVCGGGLNHRFGLFDRILIKDNHLAALRHEAPNAIEATVRRARARYPQLTVEVEAEAMEQVEQAVRAGADVILLDNMPAERLREAVRLVNGRARTEASGGVNLSTVRAIAEAGVDFISVGALTHSARAVDIALDFDTR
jgi:nicotinate-nucleotide pyrophosphorylase (carboxylating)